MTREQKLDLMKELAKFGGMHAEISQLVNSNQQLAALLALSTAQLALAGVVARLIEEA